MTCNWVAESQDGVRQSKQGFEGCQTVIYCSVAKEVAQETGKYYGNCRMKQWHQAANDDGVARKL